MSTVTPRSQMSEIAAWLGGDAHLDAKARAEWYDRWAENYEEHMSLLSYRSHLSAIEFLTEHFVGPCEKANVLDVGCGTGLVAKKMSELGFKHFTGVDGSQGMLDKAKESGLYQSLKQALLGTDSLPAENDAFDVVIVAGALGVGFVPVSVVEELCQAAKPGGLVCISMGSHTTKEEEEFRDSLKQKLQLMEKEGLWKEVGIRKNENYMLHINEDTSKDTDMTLIPGTTYLYRKC